MSLAAFCWVGNWISNLMLPALWRGRRGVIIVQQCCQSWRESISVWFVFIIVENLSSNSVNVPVNDFVAQYLSHVFVCKSNHILNVLFPTSCNLSASLCPVKHLSGSRFSITSGAALMENCEICVNSCLLTHTYLNKLNANQIVFLIKNEQKHIFLVIF